MTHKSCRSSLLRLQTVLLMALCGAAHAQSGSGLGGDISYTRGSGSGGLTTNSLVLNLEPAALPVSLGLDTTQSLVNNAEISTQWGAGIDWNLSPVWSLYASTTTLNDDLVKVTSRGVSVAWNLHKQWQWSRATRVEVERTTTDYSPQSTSQSLSGRIPQQQRTRLEIRQGINADVEVYASFDDYAYSVDPVDLARALLNRKVRRVNAATRLGDLLDRSQTLGLTWDISDAWNLDLSASQSRTVVTQNQRQRAISMRYLFHPKASIVLQYSDSAVDALVAPSGASLLPSQNDTVIELGIKWLF